LEGDIHRDSTIYVWEVGDKGKVTFGVVRGSRFEVRGSRFEVRGSRFDQQNANCKLQITTNDLRTTPLLHHHSFFLLIRYAIEISGVTGLCVAWHCKNLARENAVRVRDLRDIGVENR
jgi:hypothetical protein